jgi:hypothetical protein
MSRPIVIVGGVLALALALAAWRINVSSRSTELPYSTANVPPAAAPLCPWREPEGDLKLFFPDATRYESQTRILSGRRVEMAERLGRTPTGDENALRVYPVYREEMTLGAVMVRRVKGTFGAIELVVAVDANQHVRGVRLQRLREPEPIAAALRDPRWLAAFDGKCAESSWPSDGMLAGLPAESRASAQAISEGVRSLLIQFAATGPEQADHVQLTSHH